MDEASGPLTVDLLPARHGDAVLVGWGPEHDRHHLLVDAGPARGYEQMSSQLARATSALDLLVLSHVDADHIEGTILLTNDAGLGVDVAEVWFNGPGQLSDELSAAQGEMFAALVGAREIPLNRAFDGMAVRVRDDGPLPTRCVHGLTLTVLGPSGRALARLRDAWNPVLEDEALHFPSPEAALDALRRRRSLNPDDPYLGSSEDVDPAWVTELAARPAPLDDSVTNASSIVLLAEYGGASVLLAGDATVAELTAGLRRLLDERGQPVLRLGALKMPHHGSVRNVTRELLTLAPADHYLFSSDGSRFGHPDAGGVARVLEYGRPGAELLFNYRTPQTLLWDDEQALAGFRVRYPEPGSDGIRLALPASLTEQS